MFREIAPGRLMWSRLGRVPEITFVVEEGRVYRQYEGASAGEPVPPEHLAEMLQDPGPLGNWLRQQPIAEEPPAEGRLF